MPIPLQIMAQALEPAVISSGIRAELGLPLRFRRRAKMAGSR
jgi:hypothetical protein